MHGRTLKRTAMIGTALCALVLGGCSMFDDPQGAGEIAGRAAPGTTPASVTASTILNIAEQTRAAGDLGSAIGFYRRAISMDPTQVKAYAGLGDTLNMAGAPNDAIEAFRAGLAIAPNDPDLLRGYGFALLALNQPAGAIERFQKALAFSKDARTYGGLGVAQDLLSDYTAAEASFNAALALNPHDVNLRNNLGLSQALAGKYTEAIETLHAAASDGAAGPRQRLNLALVLGLAGQTDEAAQVARIDLDERSVRSNIAYYLMLRALPPDLRAQALLNPGSTPVGQPKPAGKTNANLSEKEGQSSSEPQKLASHPVTQVKSTPLAPAPVTRTNPSTPVPEIDPAASADRNEHADATEPGHASSGGGNDSSATPEPIASLPPGPAQWSPSAELPSNAEHDESTTEAKPTSEMAAAPDTSSADTSSAAGQAGSVSEAKPGSDEASALASSVAATPSHDGATAAAVLGDAPGKWIQLGALPNEHAAEASWKQIQRQNEDLLNKVGHAVQRADLGPGHGVFFRLRAGPFNSFAHAQSLCSSLKSRNIDCFVAPI